MELITLSLAVCIDLFASALSFAVFGIKLPVKSAVLVSFIGSGVLTLSLFISSYISFADHVNMQRLGAAVLILFGALTVMQKAVKSFIGKKPRGRMASIFIDSSSADADGSKDITAKEAVMLGVALSSDSLLSGFGAGLGQNFNVLVFPLCFAVGLLCTLLGKFIGGLFKKNIKNRPDLCVLSGLILIFLGIFKLVS